MEIGSVADAGVQVVPGIVENRHIPAHVHVAVGICPRLRNNDPQARLFQRPNLLDREEGRLQIISAMMFPVVALIMRGSPIWYPRKGLPKPARETGRRSERHADRLLGVVFILSQSAFVAAVLYAASESMVKSLVMKVSAAVVGPDHASVPSAFTPFVMLGS